MATPVTSRRADPTTPGPTAPGPTTAGASPGSEGPPPARPGRLGELRELATTTRPGRLAVAGAGVLVLVLLAGVLGLVAVTRSDGAAADVVTTSGPLTDAAQELYRALADADASAAQAVLAGADTSAAVRLRYQADITDAGAALAVVSRGSEAGTAGRADDPATRIATGLPVYTGLVETARTADRQGLAVGGAYLREASAFLRGDLLPAARAIYDEQSAALDDDHDTADGGVWTVLAALALLGAIAAVVVLHRRVARTTKRRVTPGLVLAGAALVVLAVWGAVALGAAAVSTGAATDDGTDPNRAAVAARFLVLQSRGDDILGLVTRGSGEQYEAGYAQRWIRVLGYDGVLARGEQAAPPDVAADLAEARAAAYASITVHSRVRSLDANGNADEAVALTLSEAPDGGVAATNRTEAALQRAVDTTAASAADDEAAAAAATTLLTAGVVVLTLLAAYGVVAGLWPRLQEYR